MFRRIKKKILEWFDDELTYMVKRQQLDACRISKGTRFTDAARVINGVNNIDAIQIGQNSLISGGLLVFETGGRISIGEWCYVGTGTEIRSMREITIGNRVLIANNVNIVDNTAHSFDASERHQHFKKIITTGHPDDWEDLPGIKAEPIIIEDDVWISFGVTILKGVRIGARSVIAAGSIVTKDIPPDTFYRCKFEPVMKSIK